MSTTAASTAPTAEMSQVENATIPPQSPPQSLRDITATLPPIVSTSSEARSTDYAPVAATIEPQTQTHTPMDNAGVTSELQRPEPALLPPPATTGEAESTDNVVPPIISATGPHSIAVHITLLLTTGARHPFTIDQKYLKRRHVAGAAEQQEETDPFGISVYTMKELIWKDWREEWEPRPTTPGSIRLIHFGKLLDDKMSLKDCRFLPDTPNVVHMTVKPADIVDEEENTKGGKGSGRRRGSSDREGGFRCCIVM